MPVIDVVLLAGGVPGPDDPLYPLTQGRPKSLLELGGQAMIHWVMAALNGAQTIRNIILVGLTEAQLPEVASARPLTRLPDRGSLLDNLTASAECARSFDLPPSHLLVVSSDVPLITAAMVDWNVRAALETDHQAYYNLIPQQVMEARFPGSRRTFFRLKEGRFTGGDIGLIKAEVMSGYNPAWRKIIEARKSALKQAALVGLDSLLLMALGQLSIARGERIVSRRLGVHGRILICPHAEVGMDVDKPHQYELVKRELEGKARGDTD